MTSVADFLSAGSARDKVVTAAEAIQLIRDGDTVAIEGFGGQCFPEELTIAPETRFLSSGSPRNLGLVFASRKATAEDGAWTGSATKGCSAAPSAGTGACPAIQKLAVENKIAGHNLP
jgi:propionate CoA-transferase